MNYMIACFLGFLFIHSLCFPHLLGRKEKAVSGNVSYSLGIVINTHQSTTPHSYPNPKPQTLILNPILFTSQTPPVLFHIASTAAAAAFFLRKSNELLGIPSLI